MTISKNIRQYYYSLFDLLKLDKNGGDPNGPVVSLTTVPHRIDNIKPTLVSLLRQTVKPKRIEINLSEELFAGRKIPMSLLNLENVKICWQKKDYGPATKLIATIERYQTQNERIVIVDDDMYYSKDMISDLMAADMKADGKHVFCINGFLLPRDLKSESIGSDKALKSGTRKVAVIEGCGGYILRSNHLDWKLLLNLENAPARALFDDDIWFSGHLSKAGVDKIQIPTGKRKSLVNSHKGSAISGDRWQLQSDLMIFFKDDWKDYEYERDQPRTC
ncbi:MAG TPA: glycosyltransferase family A protein [Nitrospirota bacterium]|nr:glycosyltransferase family A protein [Nitrospirota bacterium]